MKYLSILFLLIFASLINAQTLIFESEKPSASNGKIAFHSDRSGVNQIYTMNLDGSNQTNISNNGFRDIFAEWSPDGSKIAFTSRRNNNDDIYVMNADGSNQVRLTTNPDEDSIPSWSPDGRKIIYQSFRGATFKLELYTMNADGSNQTLLLGGAFDQFAKYSPDGTRITFTSNRGGGSNVWVMNADGTNLIRLTNSGNLLFFDAAWSPDSSKIAFSVEQFGLGSGTDDIWVMNADGSNQINLTAGQSGNFYPYWSPDGTKIVFTRFNSESNFDIYSMNADGSGRLQLTSVGSINWYPTWQRIASSNPTVCSYSISPTSQDFSAAAGEFTVTVATQTGCSYSSISNNDFITITGGAGGGTVTFTVAANSGAVRTGTLFIAGQTFTVTQAAGVKSRKRVRFF
jgi:Tol biopolymer transport system component